MRNRSIIYIDGFNLYYGAVKNTPWKWLDMEKYFSLLRQDDDIQIIKYFTAKIHGSHKPNQDVYIKALLTLNKVQIIYGLFKYKNIKCLVRNCTYQGSKLFDVPEEKGTDVNIAVHMIKDAINDECDRLIVISGDSDLVPAVKAVKLITPNKIVIVYVPANNIVRGAANELRNSSDRHKTLPNNLLPKAQFPDQLIDSEGGIIQKPLSWSIK
ncbi:MAG: NYN domain-containing protein [Atribacterota bacterium]|nr:NYN domain-containing protein [Atribacterota bacterium]